MKVCASPSCSARAVSLRAALATGWQFLAGRLWCARCYFAERSDGEQTYERGDALGCPTCACAEPHVCPFLYADAMDEPRRSRVLAHIRAQLRDEIDETEMRRLEIARG